MARLDRENRLARMDSAYPRMSSRRSNPYPSAVGQRRSYGKVPPGGQHEQHTFEGHVWEVVDRDGRLVNVFALDIADGVVQTVRSIINPAKLGHLGPLADVQGLLRERRGPEE